MPNSNLNDEIAELKRKLGELESFLDEIAVDIVNLKSANHQEIQQKEKELEAWHQKLRVLQQEKKQIEKDIKDKVAELKKSNLSNAEKQAKINQLLTEHSEELEELDQLLYQERTNYREIRDKLISKLCEPCEVCPEKERMIKNLEQRVTNLLALVILAIFASVLLFFLFLYSIYLHKRERERERERAKRTASGSNSLGWLVKRHNSSLAANS